MIVDSIILPTQSTVFKDSVWYVPEMWVFYRQYPADSGANVRNVGMKIKQKDITLCETIG